MLAARPASCAMLHASLFNACSAVHVFRSRRGGYRQLQAK